MPKQYWRNGNTREAVKSAFHSCQYLISFDTETTGLSSERDVVVEFGGIKYRIENERKLVPESKLHLYIRPPFYMPAKATEVNGLTNEFLSTQPTEDEVFEEIENFFGYGNAIAAYNSGFDVNFLKAMYSRHGKTFDASHEIDILKMARDFVKPSETANYKLATICELLGLNKDFKFHGALDDATASSAVMELILNDYFADEVKPAVEKSKPSVYGVRFWEGYRGKSRIYVSTSLGAVFFDCFTKNWGSNDCDLEKIDMDHVESRALAITGAPNIEAFASYKGKYLA